MSKNEKAHKLLLDSGTIIDGTIYVCLATDVLDNTVRTSEDVTDKYLLSVYFPLLVAQNLNNKSDIENLEKASNSNRKIINISDDIFNKFEINIVYFYSIIVSLF